jgi:hypothetical protein
MSSFDWKSFLQQWSQAILESMTEEEKAYLPRDILDSGWLGYPGATEEQIARAEARLGIALPPSYRAFLRVTNGWRQTAKQTESFSHRLWSTEEIERFAARHPRWIQAFNERMEINDVNLDDDLQELDDQWEPITISDAEYLVYGDDQDPRKIRPEYLRTAIEISDVGVDSIYLLNPQVTTPDGEWEAWFFADYLPGADRYPSFQAMMEAEYSNFLELRQTDLGIEDTPTKATGKEFSHSSITERRATTESDDNHSDSEEELQAESGTVAWQSLKLLMIDFQARSSDKQPEFRTLVISSQPGQSQNWSGLPEDRLQQWVHHQLLGVKNVSLSRYGLISTPNSELSAELQVAEDTPFDHPGSVEVGTEGYQEIENEIQKIQQQEVQSEELQLALNPEIVQLAIRQPSNFMPQIVVSPTDLRKFPKMGQRSLSSQQPFSIEVAFSLAGQQLRNQRLNEVFYKIQVFAQNRIDHQWVELGETNPISLNIIQSTYVARLLDKSLKPGMYRLQVVTSLFGKERALASFELPLLNVA